MRFRCISAVALALFLVATSAAAAERPSKPAPGSTIGQPAGAPRAERPSGLIFNGARIGSFALNQSARGAVHQVPDPAGSGERVFKMTVDDGDVAPITPTDNPRAELQSPARIRPGEQFWWSAKFLLPRNFPKSIPGWVTVLGGPYGAPFDGPAPWHLEINHNHIQWTRNRTYDFDVPWQIRIPRGKWIRILVHNRFSEHGFVEMWVNGHRVTFFKKRTFNPNHVRPVRRLRMRTRDGSNGAGRNFVSLLSYRKAGMFPSLTIFQGQTKVGHSRASVSE